MRDMQVVPPVNTLSGTQSQHKKHRRFEDVIRLNPTLSILYGRDGMLGLIGPGIPSLGSVMHKCPLSSGHVRVSGVPLLRYFALPQGVRKTMLFALKAYLDYVRWPKCVLVSRV